MAILRQLALVPTVAELRVLGALDGTVEIWQSPSKYGNLPSSAYLCLADGRWLRIGSDSKDVHFKFECISLTIGLDEVLATQLLRRIVRVAPGQAALLFRAEWLRPEPGEGKEGDWERVVNNLACVDTVPTKQLSGCLSWWGILFSMESEQPVLVCLDEFPLSIRITTDKDEVAQACLESRVVTNSDVGQWITALDGWEIQSLE